MKQILIGFVLAFLIGGNMVNATITELETNCGLFDCYTTLETSFNIPPVYIGNTYDIEELPDTYKKHHIGNITGVKITVLSKNSVNVTGDIAGASKNLWGIVLLNDPSFENSTWWNSTFLNRVNISTNFTENDYQYYLETNNATILANIDNGIIRIVNETDDLMDYFIENINASELRLWIRGDNQSSDTYIMYYNNDSVVTDLSSGDDTFLFYCGFENGFCNDDFTEDSDCIASVNATNNTHYVEGSNSWEYGCVNDDYLYWYAPLPTGANEFNTTIFEGWAMIIDAPQPLKQILYSAVFDNGANSIETRAMEGTNPNYLVDGTDVSIGMPFEFGIWYKIRFIMNTTTAGTPTGYVFNGSAYVNYTDDTGENITRFTMGDAWGTGNQDAHGLYDYPKIRRYRKGLNYALMDEQVTAYISTAQENYTTTTVGTTTTALGGGSDIGLNITLGEERTAHMNYVLAFGIFLLCCVFLIMGHAKK